MATDQNAMPDREDMEPEAEEATEAEGAVAEALEGINKLLKRGLISPEQYQATLAKLGETVADEEPEPEQPLTGADMAAGLKAVMSASSAKHEEKMSKTTTTKYSIGDRVKVKPGKVHDDMTKGKTGTIQEITTPALGIRFDGMTKMHKWHTDDEVESA